MDGIYKLKGVVQHYNWGGTEFIPQLLGVGNPDAKPFAEYWLGAHPNAPSVVEEENISLLELIKRHPEQMLGVRTAEKFGSLPYLFKILDVRQMLSIQVHPSKSSAIEEYKRENEKAIPLTAPHRNYKDQNHKPELMVALSDFWLLHGFKNKTELTAILSRPELQFLLPVFQSGGYKALYEEVMTLPQARVNEVMAPFMDKMIPLYEDGSLQKDSEDFWAARAALSFCRNDHYDRGIFSIYFFNLLHLKKGEAIYQPAGLPHAYLEGQNVEVMASSDNVLRAGLTNKHVDVPELMKHVLFEATEPKIIRAADGEMQNFEAPVEEFFLTRYRTSEKISLSYDGPSIIFAVEGTGLASSRGKSILLQKGEAVFTAASSEVSLEPSGVVTAFRVTAPADKI